MRQRKFTKYGNADIIRLRPHDKEDLGLEYNDLVDIDRLKKVKAKDLEDNSCCDMNDLNGVKHE